MSWNFLTLLLSSFVLASTVTSPALAQQDTFSTAETQDLDPKILAAQDPSEV